MKVRAAVVEKKDGPFVFRDVEADAPRSDEIVVRIVATGICHTDAHIRSQGYETPLPFVLGHEGAGLVESVGSRAHGGSGRGRRSDHRCRHQ